MVTVKSNIDLQQAQECLNYSRIVNDQLSFKGVRLVQDRHVLHPYPAMLHPRLVDYLLNRHSVKNDVVFDPFCGSGVTLLQASRLNLSAFGCDINPLALLITHAKTRIYKKYELLEDLRQFQESLLETKNFDIPSIKNIDYWYSDEVIEELGRARNTIKMLDLTYPSFFAAIFGRIAREQSLTRNGEFKRYRVADPSSPRYQCKVIKQLVEKSVETVAIFLDSKNPLHEPQAIFHNSQNRNPHLEAYDLVISSPPYGDSGTTVAYGQYSSFALEWLQDINPFAIHDVSVDRDGLGKKYEGVDAAKYSNDLSDVLSKISSRNHRRSEQVRWFFNGYYKALHNTISLLSDRGKVCLVVGNRTVCSCQIPMDQVTASFLSSLGLQVHGIESRRIHNKVMPLSNSPTNQKGRNGPTMNCEFIVTAAKS